MVDILEVTQDVIDLFKIKELSRVQSMFVLKAVEMTIQEDIIKDFIEGNKTTPGVG